MSSHFFRLPLVRFGFEALSNACIAAATTASARTCAGSGRCGAASYIE